MILYSKCNLFKPIFRLFYSILMKILFDHQVFSLEVMGGMSKYYTELMSSLIQEGYEVIVPVWRTHNYYLLQTLEAGVNILWSETRSVSTFLQNTKFKGRQNLVFWYNKYKLLNNIDSILEGVDLVHITLFDPYLIDILKKKNIPFVFNVYDLNHKTQNLKKWFWNLQMCDYAEQGIQLLWEEAQSIICVSKTTKNDLLEYYPTLNSEKIKVIYHSVDLSHIWELQKQSENNEEYQNLLKKLGVKKFILFIGKRSAEYKNFIPFMRAIAPLLEEDLHCICLGHESFTENEKNLLRELKIENLVHQISGDESVKYYLFSKASCFVYPSLAEGFGIPVLEAWAGWCPVLCSNIPVFFEIGAGAAFYFDPRNIENMRELIQWVSKNDNLQEDLKKAGLERVKLFDKWGEINTTLSLYEDCISSKI